jgi:hypothetical protein
MQDPRGGSIAKDAFLDFVKRSNGTPVDPEVVIQFVSLQQTGNFSPSLSNGASMQQAALDALFAVVADLQGKNSAPLPSPATISASISSAEQPAIDALFALAGIQDNDWAAVEALLP